MRENQLSTEGSPEPVIVLGDIPVNSQNAGQFIDGIDRMLNSMKHIVKNTRRPVTEEDLGILIEAEALEGNTAIGYLMTHTIADVGMPENWVDNLRENEQIKKLEREVKDKRNPYTMRRLLFTEWRLAFEAISTHRPVTQTQVAAESA